MAVFRKSKKIGPFRITASKSGLSASTGVKGLRISANSKGQIRRTVSLPGAGIRDTALVGSARPRSGDGSRPWTPSELEMSVDCVDGTGGSRQLLADDPTVSSYKVVGVPGGNRSIQEIAAWAGIRPVDEGWARGIRDGLVLDRGEGLEVVLLVTPEDSPGAFSKAALKAGRPIGRLVGRINKRDEGRWRTFAPDGVTVRVGICIDATPGLDPVMQVRFRPDEIMNTGDHHSAPDDSAFPPVAVTETVPPEQMQAQSAPAGWYPDALGRHQYRYWDGTNWTSYVATDGVQSSDPI